MSNASSSNLTQAARDLSVQWQQTRAAWRDAKAVEFERRYLEPLPALVARTSGMMTEIDAIVRKARRDCEQR